MTQNATDRSGLGRGLLLASMLLCAANFRAPITGVGPLLEVIRGSFGLSAAQAGLLTTLPIVAFATVSPFCVGLVRRFGLERTLMAAMILLGAGIALRSAGPLWALFAGTAMMGAAIALGNVLLPTLVMRDFPDRVTATTTFYVITMALSGAAFSVLVAPLFEALGSWRIALGLGVVPVLLAIFVWSPRTRRGAAIAPAGQRAKSPSLWRTPLAWQVTGFMALNSFVFYVVITWLPAMLQAKGHTMADSGALHGLMQAVGIIPLLLALPLMSRLKDQRMAAFLVSLLAAIGFLGLALAPQWAVVWVSAYGAASGAGLVLALSFASLRASSVEQGAALSGMAQSVGYTLAAIGPASMGALHDAMGSWDAALWICAAAALVQAVIGLYAGRAVKLALVAPRSPPA
ncbi:MFS transporter [Phenylobacterium sp.]|uniref:MFS transporter n=1 Tax=Phenylobacterium sp. TaxID=1871053 RepID=UPI0027370E52|nr:MFS transporter [Phenylobacterium sp.]MDP3660307.1 MFS transporter [Phenylobacterium sp.]